MMGDTKNPSRIPGLAWLSRPVPGKARPNVARPAFTANQLHEDARWLAEDEPSHDAERHGKGERPDR